MTTITTINQDNKVTSLINIFTVDPKNQQRLVDILIEATKKVNGLERILCFSFYLASSYSSFPSL
jgi:hypothetical protein